MILALLGLPEFLRTSQPWCLLEHKKTVSATQAASAASFAVRAPVIVTTR
jgi:hypothetical protein